MNTPSGVEGIVRFTGRFGNFSESENIWYSIKAFPEYLVNVKTWGMLQYLISVESFPV
jgi:hypothetical protein